MNNKSKLTETYRCRCGKEHKVKSILMAKMKYCYSCGKEIEKDRLKMILDRVGYDGKLRRMNGIEGLNKQKEIKKTNKKSHIYRCRVCDELIESKQDRSQLLEHLKEKHNIETLKEYDTKYRY